MAKGQLAKTRSQSVTLFDLSWRHVPGTTQVFHHSAHVHLLMTTESWWVFARVTDPFQQVGKFTNMECFHNEDPLWIYIYKHKINLRYNSSCSSFIYLLISQTNNYWGLIICLAPFFTLGLQWNKTKFSFSWVDSVTSVIKKNKAR